jgi:putative CocE/NonD family hydrolase
MARTLCLALLLATLAPSAAAQQDLAFEPDMARLAERAIEVYKEDGRDPYLNVLFRLQLVAGRYADAVASIHELRDLRQDPALYVQYEIYADAKRREATDGVAFEEAFARSFRDVHGRLDDLTAHAAQYSFGAWLAGMEDDLRAALERQKGASRIALPDALDLLRKHQVADVYRNILPLAPALVDEDDRRRYVVQDDLLIKTRDGAAVSALVVRPRSAAARIPALLEFTIYARREWSYAEAKRSAANGYAGVVAYTRGKGASPVAPVPYEHDGDDAYDVIDWIGKQPWGDGRVGMFGGSYEGFTQWAAAKRRHPALKAIMPSVPVAPGIDVPMEGNVFLSFVYKWVPYVTNNKTLDDATYEDGKRWSALERAWYVTGQPYRSLESIDGWPSPIFRRWLDHPSYDRYWQRMIPYKEEFARIDIPVLTTTGYYDGCLVSALYYFAEHTKYNPRANHYLVVGPYDHVGAQRRSSRVLMGYETDPSAALDVERLRYEWFDHVLRGGPRPAILKDRVNYQVMGADEWKHAPSLAGVANGTIRFHLTPARAGGHYRLAEMPPASDAFVAQTVDLADRTDVDREPSPLIVTRTLDASNGLAFVSDPVREPVEVSGLFSGRLDFVVNKRDMDLNIVLYELMPSGEYLQLSHYLGRASYARDRSRRHLLVPGKRARLDISSGRMTSRKLRAGSRLVVVLRIYKQPDAQLNYGTGRDVSDESIADAREPLAIRWYGTSYVDVPVRK